MPWNTQGHNAQILNDLRDVILEAIGVAHANPDWWRANVTAHPYRAPLVASILNWYLNDALPRNYDDQRGSIALRYLNTLLGDRFYQNPTLLLPTNNSVSVADETVRPLRPPPFPATNVDKENRPPQGMGLKIVRIQKVGGCGLTRSKKVAIGTAAALAGLAGVAGAAAMSNSQPTHLDRAMKDLAANQLQASRTDSFVPTMNRGEASSRLAAKNTAMSALLARQYGMPPARSYDEIVNNPFYNSIRELPGDNSRLRPDQLRRRPVNTRRV